MQGTPHENGGGGWSDETAVSIEHGPVLSATATHFLSQDNVRNTRELFEVLQESTRTSLLVQVRQAGRMGGAGLSRE